MGSLKKRRKSKINKHKRRKQLRANRHKKRTWQKEAAPEGPLLITRRPRNFRVGCAAVITG